jgi:hypothetical protein
MIKAGVFQRFEATYNSSNIKYKTWEYPEKQG